MLHRLGLGLLTLLLATSCAVAKSIKFGSVTVVLTTPGGACEMDESKPLDKRLVATARGMLANTDNTLLAYYGDCQQLIDMRAGNRLSLTDKSQYQVLASTIEQGVAGDVKEFLKAQCADLRTSGKKYAADDVPRVSKRVDELVKNGKYYGSEFVGVLEETPNACYAGLVQKFKEGNGQDVTQIAIIAMMVVKRRVMYYYRFLPYANDTSIATSLAAHKPDVAAFLAANGE